MSKLALDLDALDVQTFTPDAAAPEGGTVRGHDATVLCSAQSPDDCTAFTCAVESCAALSCDDCGTYRCPGDSAPCTNYAYNTICI